jgi:predicted flap endonuclease-1-like 5' DNA nuclease
MCTGPELLCLDEPAAGLNPKESLALNTLLNDIKDNTGTSILLIEHDMSVVMQISDHVVVLEYGRKISDGDPSFVKSDPKVIAAYLGIDDQEVETVLVEVGDEHVIEQFDGTPDPEQGPSPSSSMMAGPVSDTIEHADHSEGLVKVAPGASKADRVKPAESAKAPSAKAKSAAKAKPAVEPAKAPRAPKAKSEAAAGAAVTQPAAPKPARSRAKPTDQAPVSLMSAPAVKPKATVKAKPAETPAAKAPAKPVAKAAVPASKPAAAKATVPAKSPAAAKPARPKPTPASAAPAAPDDLTLIKGIGPVNARKLGEHGITTFAQIAAWKKADIVAAEAYLEFDGRIAREDWVGQARRFARGAKPAKAGKTGGRG